MEKAIKKKITSFKEKHTGKIVWAVAYFRFLVYKV